MIIIVAPDPQRPYPDTIPIRSASFGFGIPYLRGLGPLWRLRREWRFEVSGYGWYTIPAGYEYDKASIPPVFWGWPFNYLPDGPCALPALQHDFLCDLLLGGSVWLQNALGGDVPRPPPAHVIHECFEQWLLEEGERPSKARAMGAAVKRFGPGGYLRPGVLFKHVITQIKP